VAANIAEGEVIAAHDIGALGYFDNHALIDLAGLVSPEVIPIIRDEAALASYLSEKDVSYFIAFPDFYPLLSTGAEKVFSTEGDFAPLFGRENMAVYRWR
jgi:hypothetical protein